MEHRRKNPDVLHRLMFNLSSNAQKLKSGSRLIDFHQCFFAWVGSFQSSHMAEPNLYTFYSLSVASKARSTQSAVMRSNYLLHKQHGEDLDGEWVSTIAWVVWHERELCIGHPIPIIQWVSHQALTLLLFVFSCLWFSCGAFTQWLVIYYTSSCHFTICHSLDM